MIAGVSAECPAPAGWRALVALVRGQSRFTVVEVHFPVRIRHLEEGEPNRPVLTAELEGMAAFVDGYVLDEIPDVAVFFRRQPVVRADLAIAAHSELRQATVQGPSGIIAANTHLLERIYIRVGLRPGCNETAEPDPCL